MKAYNDIIHHETVRVAVLDMAGMDTAMHKSLPAPFQLLIREMYPAFASSYEDTCRANNHKSGLKMQVRS